MVPRTINPTTIKPSKPKPKVRILGPGGVKVLPGVNPSLKIMPGSATSKLPVQRISNKQPKQIPQLSDEEFDQEIRNAKQTRQSPPVEILSPTPPGPGDTIHRGRGKQRMFRKPVKRGK